MRRGEAFLSRALGFSLIEVLVALTIFSVLMIFSIQGFQLVSNMEIRSRDEVSIEQNFHRAWSLIGQDFLHLRTRPIRDQFGSESGAYIAGRNPYLVEFTRGGLPSLPTAPGGMIRVAYYLSDEGELVRSTWSALDTLDIEDVQEQVIMSGLEEVVIEQLNPNNFYEEIWPPLNFQGNTATLMPQMIRITLRDIYGMELVRLMPGIGSIALPGNGGQGGGGNNGNDEDAEDGADT